MNHFGAGPGSWTLGVGVLPRVRARIRGVRLCLGSFGVEGLACVRSWYLRSPDDRGDCTLLKCHSDIADQGNDR